MPRIKRWSPISHDFNRDPEIIEMRQRFGDWTALAWQEVLHEADRNDGIVRGTIDQIAFRLSPISLRKYSKTAQKLAQNLLEFAQKHNWIKVETDRIEVVNHWKYHKSQEPKKILSGSSLSEPILTKPNLINISSRRSVEEQVKHKDAATPDGFAEFWSFYPRKKSKGQAERTWRKLDPNPELFQAIMAGLRRARGSRDWLKDAGKFIPYPATWLNAKGWEDQELSFSAPAKTRSAILAVPDRKPTQTEIEKSQEFLRETINSLSNKMNVS